VDDVDQSALRRPDGIDLVGAGGVSSSTPVILTAFDAGRGGGLVGQRKAALGGAAQHAPTRAVRGSSGSPSLLPLSRR
jgi:hypothetical protein